MWTNSSSIADDQAILYICYSALAWWLVRYTCEIGPQVTYSASWHTMRHPRKIFYQLLPLCMLCAGPQKYIEVLQGLDPLPEP